MKWVKLHLLLIVLTVQLVALWQQEEPVPYFPIEISRTAASGSVNRWLFPLGIVSLGVTLRSRGLLRRYRLVWVALLCIACFDDKYHPVLNQVGVALLFVTLMRSLLLALPDDEEERLKRVRQHVLVIAAAGSIYLTRFVLKLAIVYLLELQPGDTVYERVMEIMHHSEAVWATLAIFRLCGVMQWLAFGLLAREMH